MPIRVKVCGITRVEDALTAVRLGAYAIGFIFWDKSARYIDPHVARKIVMALPPFVSVVGVYVDPSSEWVEETCSIAGLSLLQFHGDDGIDLLQYAAQYSSSNGLLLDSYVEGVPGGTGRAFDWSLIPQNLSLPLILSGGLHAKNVCAAIREAKPWAVDVSSGVEVTKGIKDADKIAAFMTGVRDGESL
jgi:phosphoribosylanthranilate isomerase